MFPGLFLLPGVDPGTAANLFDPFKSSLYPNLSLYFITLIWNKINLLIKQSCDSFIDNIFFLHDVM
jgi:hypothetical protein